MGTKILYHGNCMDGFTAAWGAHQIYGARAEYIPVNYGGDESPPDVLGHDVIILDFAYPRKVLIQMKADAKSLLVLDHHKTAQADLKGLDFAVFDMNRSGAGIAWDVLVGGNRPPLVDYVEDRDLWRFALPRSLEYNALISASKQTFDNWDEISVMPVEAVCAKGQAIRTYIERYVDQMCKQAGTFWYDGHKIPIVNAPFINTSDLVGALAKNNLFAVGWFQRADGRYQYSLRSRGEFDVSVLAFKNGGGGHKNAAGFVSERRVYHPDPIC